MHHPGPPRFLAVGETTQLAPRDPDPEATYRWHVATAPTGSSTTLGDDPVVEFAPDRPGVYTLALDAPDGTHELTARVFPAATSPNPHVMAGDDGEHSGGFSGASGGSGGERAGVSGASGSAGSLGRPPTSEDRDGRPRVSLDGGVEDGTVTIRATAKRGGRDAVDDGTLSVEFLVDDRDPTPGSLAVEGRRVRFDLADLAAPVRVHAVAHGDQYSVPDTVRVHPDGTVEPMHEPPAWSTGMTLYEVYVRGFREADPGQSVFETIEANLDYVESLGVDTLWLTPVLQHDGFEHGYNTTDFFSVADDLGTEAEFESLVAAAHERDMHVLFDLVLNHSARDHEFFQRAESGEQFYRDWYEWDEDGEPATYFEWPYIANFDYTNLHVRRHLLDAVEKWAGFVDGFRCDMAWAIPTDFWREIRDRVHAVDEEFLLLDETIPYVADFHYQAFDIHFDTTLYHVLREVGKGHAGAETVSDAIEERSLTGFPDHAGFMLYIENHDEVRYVEECGRAATRAAAAAQFTLPGVPMVYAGQEIGERERRGHVHWEHADEGLREFYRSLARTRDEIPALGYHGDYERLAPEREDDRVVAYAREHDGRRVVVALNFGAEPRRVRFPTETVDDVDRVSGERVERDENGALLVDSVAVLDADP